MRSPTFLVIDDNSDSRFLLVKTLIRKFRTAVIHECMNADKALQFCALQMPTAIVTHRTVEMSGVEMVQALRQACPDTLILMVSSIDRTEAALAAGATAFLLYDEWLRVGTVLASLLQQREKPGSLDERSESAEVPS